jgi:hypothetical protein
MIVKKELLYELNLGITKELDKYMIWQTKGEDITETKKAKEIYGDSLHNIVKDLKLMYEELKVKLDEIKK